MYFTPSVRVFIFCFRWFKCENEDPNSCSQMPGTAVQNKAKYGNSTFQQVIDTEYTGDKERGYFSD